MNFIEFADYDSVDEINLWVSPFQNVKIILVTRPDKYINKRITLCTVRIGRDRVKAPTSRIDEDIKRLMWAQVAAFCVMRQMLRIICYDKSCAAAKVIIHKSRGELILMEQNLRLGLVLGRLAVLKTAEPNLLLVTFEGSFCVRTKKLHIIKLENTFFFFIKI